MLYQLEFIDTALELALSVHKGQLDRYGAPYILHPLRVAIGARNTDETTAAILHDVVEHSDGMVTLDVLREKGFPEHIVDIVDCLSKRTVNNVEEEWEVYINRVMTNPAAMRIKLLDLQDNLDARRIDEFSEKDAARFNRYLWAWRKITVALEKRE